MESLHLSIALPHLPRKTNLPFTRLSRDIYNCRNKECSLRRGLVRAKRVGGDGGSGQEGGGRDRFVSLEGEGEQERQVGASSLWKRGLGFVRRRLGFGGEVWEEDPRGQRELEELDLFLEGKGSEIRWKEALEPTSVENVLALVLTALLLYSTVLIGWQLVVVAAAITLSALKYAVIAAILVGGLIFFI